MLINTIDIMLWVWLAIFVITIILEAVTQDFISIWFSLGSLVTLIICSWVDLWVEIIVFSVVSLVTLILTRPFLKKLMGRGVRNTNVDEFVGKRVVLQHKITKYEPGEIKVNGIEYTAILLEDSNDTIEEGSVVEIVTLKGNKVVVKKINDREGE